MALGRKGKIILVLLAAMVVPVSFEWLRLWWYRGYSRGTRTGILRKVSVKGPPYCKYLSGEMAVQGTGLAQTELWEFSVDDDRDSNPIVQQLHAAERSGERVTLKYRQDLKQWYHCTPSEYFVIGVEK
jgi:hypothetical protein